MKKANVLRLVQSILIVLLSAGIIGGNSMIAYAQNTNAEDAIVEGASVTVEGVETPATTEENTEVVSELEAVEVEETMVATEAASGEWGNIAWSYANGVLTLDLKEGKTYAYMNKPDSAPSNSSDYESESVCEMVAATYPWYQYRESITKIVINDGVKSINDVAFFNMTKMVEIEFSSDLSSIGYYAFRNCASLKAVTIPAKIPQSGFGRGVFYNCSSLEEVKGNVKISSYAYYGCNSLKSIEIPSSADEIYKYAFANCTSLTSITIPSGTEVGSYAFAGCTGLKEVTMSDARVSTYAFKDCTGLVRVNLSGSNPYIYDGAFYNCTSLAEINGQAHGYHYTYYNCQSLTSIDNIINGTSKAFIGRYEFYGCKGLDKVALGSHIDYIYEYAFANCDLKELWLDEMDDDFTYYSSALEGNPNCKVYGKLDSDAESLALASDCTFVPTDKLPQTTMSTLSSASNGIRVTWAEGEYALKYDVYRCTLVGGNYTLLKSGVTGTEYIDTDVTPGVKYYYKVVSVGELVKSELSEASTAGMYLAAPTFKKIVNVVSGVHVYWNAADGAKTYSVYRSTSKSGDYTIVKDGLTATHYIDTTAVSGKTYYYKVLAVNGSFSTSSYVEPFKPYTYVGTPDITSRINKAAGVELGWNKIEGATGYAIYRKPYVGGSWARITTISGNDTFTYTDGAVKGNNGTIYRYTVRALAGSDMKTLSGCRNTGRTMVRLSSRTLNSAVKASANSIKCNWSTSAAVSGYEVRFMIGNTVYKTFTVGNYKTGAKTFTGLPSGYNYKVQVRAYKKVDGVGSFYSAWSTAKYVQL